MFYGAKSLKIKKNHGPSLIAPFYSQELLSQIDHLRLRLWDSHHWYIYLTVQCGLRAIRINQEHLIDHELVIANCDCPRENWLDVTWVHASRIDPAVEVLSCAQLLEASNDQSEKGKQLLEERKAGAALRAKMVAEARRHS